MAQWVTLWRAAHLVGVTRGILQQRVRDGELPLHEGMVSTDALLALYPQAELEAGGMLERVVQIRDESFARRLRERMLPTQEVLAQRLFGQSQELADAQRHLQRYHALVLSLRDQLRAVLAQAPEPPALPEPPAPWAQRLLDDLQLGLARALATEPVNVLDAMDDMLKVVSAQVTVRPSGRQYAVLGRDTLLQAGLRAGLKLNYGCGNGSCGLCKVRVIAGDVVGTMHTDYALSQAEKAQGHVLACACTAASAEVTIETLEAHGPADIPAQQITATVRAVKPLAPDVQLLHLQAPRSRRLRFLAGQSVTLGVAATSDLHADHPVASCPCDDRNLQFFVPRNEADPIARALFGGQLKVGDAVTVWGPHGDFVLGEETRPLVFAACDTGFAPLKSLIEHALSLEEAPSLTLYWLATREDGHFLANQCRAWSEALDTFEYTLLDDIDAVNGAARIAAAMRRDLFDIDCCFFIAGPSAFVQALRTELAGAGVPPSALHVEVTP